MKASISALKNTLKLLEVVLCSQDATTILKGATSPQNMLNSEPVLTNEVNLISEPTTGIQSNHVYAPAPACGIEGAMSKRKSLVDKMVDDLDSILIHLSDDKDEDEDRSKKICRSDPTLKYGNSNFTAKLQLPLDWTQGQGSRQKREPSQVLIFFLKEIHRIILISLFFNKTQIVITFPS